MKSFQINKNDAGNRLDRFVKKVAPSLPDSQIQKYIRIKRVKLNGKRAEKDTRLVLGDLVELYINDEYFDGTAKQDAYKTMKSSLDILFEDENIMLINKRSGISVHDDETHTANTLINHIKAYLLEKGEYKPEEENSFAPSLCNRIDKNTEGIVIAAKNAESLRILNEKIKDKEILKFYLAVVVGKLNQKKGTLKNYLFKDADKNMVYISKTKKPGYKEAILHFKTLKTSEELSLVECELITGRTHQIRAQFAELGYPLLGDGKYGNGEINRKYKIKSQCLISYRICFAFSTDAGILNYLKGGFFEINKEPFVNKYFW